MNARINERQNEIEKLQADIRSYESQKTELLSVKEKLEKSEIECDKLKSNGEKLSQEKEKIATDLKDALNSNEESNKKVENMEKTLKKQEYDAKDKIEALQNTHAKEIKKLTEQLEKATLEGEGGLQRKEEALKEMSNNLDATKKALTELKAEKENLLIAKESETSKLAQEVAKLNDVVAEKEEKLE